jgi:hypothetical protein
MTEAQTALVQLTTEYRQSALDIREQRHDVDRHDVPDNEYCRSISALTFATSRGVEKLLDGRAVELEIARENAAETQRTIKDAIIAWAPALMGGGVGAGILGAIAKGMGIL